MSETASYPFVDLALSRRLERAEAQSNIEFVEARAKASPESRAQWIEVAGSHAMFDGADSPLTQTFGLGLLEPVTAEVMSRIEGFFGDLGAPVFHEVSPLSDPSALDQLTRRGYEPFEFTSVMFQPIQALTPGSAATHPELRVRTIDPDEAESWAAISARGWAETPELGDFMRAFGRVTARKTSGFSFIAELSGQAIATGGMSLYGGVALMAGASTVPEGRRQGAQNALLEARLRLAAEQGCDLAMMCALPGSASQRNAERRGFRIAYTRVKWRRRTAPAS